MLFLCGAYVAIIGAAIGSFLNVVILRFHSGKSLQGRSFCPVCGRRLSWYELVPVLSFVGLRGRCRTCRARISWQYPLVELATAVIFVLIWRGVFSPPAAAVGIAQAVLLSAGWSILIALFVYDLKHKVIPDGFSYSFAAVALAFPVLSGFQYGFDRIFFANILAGPALFAPFFALWYFSKGKWMGLGDGKLALGIGWFLGLGGGISAVVLSFWIGALAGVMLVAFSRFFAAGFSLVNGRKRVTMKSELPFAPFLVVGMFAVQFLHFSLFSGIL